MNAQDAKDLLEEMMEEDIKALQPKDRIFLYFSQVLEYFQPKRQRTSIDQDNTKLPEDVY